MNTRQFIKALALLLIAVPALAQQANGRNYAHPVAVVGNQQQWGSLGTGVNGLIIEVPVVTPALPALAWGTIHVNETVADTAGTNHHGVAIYNAAGTLLCSTYPARTIIKGENTYDLTGCGVPAPSTTYNLMWLTDWTGDNPGTNQDGPNQTLFCPGTGIYGPYAVATSFPSTLPTMNAGVSACMTVWADVILANSNGQFYGGHAGYDNHVGGIPNGPWGNNGRYFGALNSLATFVSFSDGLVNATYPTTTTLGNSTHGTACTWSFASSNQVIKGGTSGHANLNTPATAGGVNYGGYSASPLTLEYLTTNASRNYVICTMPSTYTSMTVAYHLKTDVPDLDTQSNQYDAGGLESSDSTDQLSPTIIAGGSSLNLFMQCEIDFSGTAVSGVVAIKSGVNYLVSMIKNTGGALDYMYVFNQDQGGTYVGVVTCASKTGTHNAGYFFSPINGAETNAVGDHVWADTYEANITGGYITP